MPGAREIGAEGGRTDIVERDMGRALRACRDHRFKRGKHPLAVGLAERDQAHPGGHPICRERLQVCGKRRRERDPVADGGDGDSHRIGDRAVPDLFQPVERVAGPGRAGRLDEGIALRRRFQVPLLRRCESGGKFGDRTQGFIVAAFRRAVRVRKQHCVGKAAAISQHHLKPVAKRRRVCDVTRLHRPLDAA
jgi:hypothetical protein